MAKIKNMHYTICLKVISSSAQVALPPAFARLEQRGLKSNQSEDRTVERNASRKAFETRDELLERQHYLVECHNRIIMLMLNKKNLMNMFLLMMIISHV